jgi:hypothetical protein
MVQVVVVDWRRRRRLKGQPGRAGVLYGLSLNVLAVKRGDVIA